MERMELKSSISRKSLHNLSVRQRSRIRSEIKNRLRNFSKYVENIAVENIVVENNRDLQNNSILLVTECVSFTNNSDNCNYKYDVTLEDDASISSFNGTSIEPSFQNRLASCFVDNNLTHVQSNSIIISSSNTFLFCNFTQKRKNSS